jgi:G:T/U-mismatch repair DNA glycosylase
MYKTLSIFQAEELPFETYIPNEADKLIIGTFPTESGNRAFDFFYPNRGNVFWKILSNIAGNGFELDDHESAEEAVESRMAILDKLKLGITDIGKMVLRQSNSSLDGALFPIMFTNVFCILDEHPSIKKLILTSKSGQNSVSGWLRGYFELNNFDFPLTKKGPNSERGNFTFNGRTIEIVTVPSTSRAARKVSDEDKMHRFREELAT